MTMNHLTSGVQTMTMTTQNRPRNERGKTPALKRPSRLWLWVVAAFMLQLAVWTAWIVIASKNRVQEVPLVTAE